MNRKLLYLCLALCLVLPFIAFAGGQKAQSQSASSSTRRTDGWFAGKDFSRHFDVEYAEGWIDENLNYAEGDDWVRNWANNFNVTYNIIPMPADSWAERTRVWVNAGDPPEWFTYPLNLEEARTWAEQGLVKKLPDNWKTKYPNLAAAHKASGVGDYTDEEFGGTYFLHRAIFFLNSPPVKKHVGHWTFYLRKDWGEAAGYPPKDAMKFSEIMEYARRVKTADPGKVGSGLIPISILASEINQLISINGILGYAKNAQGRYYWTGGDKFVLDGLKLAAQAYEEGLLNKEFYTVKDPDQVGAFYTGKAAVTDAAGMGWRMTEFDTHFQNDLGLNYFDTVTPVVPIGEDGKFHGREQGMQTWGSIVFSPTIDDAKLERILYMLDYSCTKEGQYEIRLGLKDIDWKEEANGEITTLIPPGSVATKYALTPVYSWMFILPDDFMFIDPATKKPIRDKIRDMYILRERLSDDGSFPPDPDWLLEFFTPKTKVPEIRTADDFSAIIVRGGNIEASWRAWVQEKQALLQPVLDELNAALGR